MIYPHIAFKHLPLMIEEGDFFFMGEAIISRGGGLSGGSSSGRTGLITEIFTSNTLWKVPEGIRNNEVSVRIFGGGEGGNYDHGGAGGFMNNGIVNVSNDSEIYITIGDGGKLYNAGGTTSFGSYLSAIGGGIIYKYTGGGFDRNSSGGGSGGGGGSSYQGSGTSTYIGGIGFQFGGGGGYSGGNGGKWGGAGGSLSSYQKNNNPISYGGCIYNLYSYTSNNISYVIGYSGLGGNGSYKNTNAEDGTNTIGMGLEFEGTGNKGISLNKNTKSETNSKIAQSGGGYGGCGGYSYSLEFYDYVVCGAGGGGGYGANGGNGAMYFINSKNYGFAHGGGGGYGGDGGDGTVFYDNINSSYRIASGGGGGYGKHGKGGEYKNNTVKLAGIAAGSMQYIGIIGNNNIVYDSTNIFRGGQGICILQYYID